ncbi:hypothetical protein Avbf_08856 [Armadillidium vulgare]|nr:hypothetical protein Avbf_08856 [Armadillidium vulgare]
MDSIKNGNQDFGTGVDPRDFIKNDSMIFVATRHLESNSLGSGSQGVQHWLVIAEFPHKILYLDGDDVNGRIIPRVVHFDSSYWDYRIITKKKISNIKVSVRQLEKVAYKNPINYQEYELIFKNCQTWVKNFLAMLGLKENLSPVSSKVVMTGAAASFLLGPVGFALSAGTIYALNKCSSSVSSRNSGNGR